METKPARDLHPNAGENGGWFFLRAFLSGALLAVAATTIGCEKLSRPVSQPYFSDTLPPQKQELRWNNGGLPASLDPARAVAPPETDIVRAVFEGLTETDPRTLNAVPGVAETWTPNEDFRVWTFNLRRDARWSDGTQVTAYDFERAWKRLAVIGDKAVHRNLLANIAGMPRIQAVDPSATPGIRQNSSLTDQRSVSRSRGTVRQPQPGVNDPPEPGPTIFVAPPAASRPSPSPLAEMAPTPGFVAVDDLTFQVNLIAPDKDFPKVAAHPIFSPRHVSDIETDGGAIERPTKTNGAFRIAEITNKGVRIERSETYWNRDEVRLERVWFISADSPEDALAAYRNGELDAITNTRFSSLTLKLLTPYDDLRTTTHSALNFYEVNTVKAPFSDRRVREALSNAVERERLAESDTDGITRPAFGFLPFGGTLNAKLSQDKAKARELLERAGFPDGQGFPIIRLVVNRNDTQQKVARSVARMWKENLNIETEIVVRELQDIEKAREAGDYDVIRRGAVFPTSADAVNLRTIFDQVRPPLPETTTSPTLVRPGNPKEPGLQQQASNSTDTMSPTSEILLTEEEAMHELRAIPLYFPMSYSLVKPYVTGFDMNSLDVIMLANVSIDTDWAPTVN